MNYKTNQRIMDDVEELLVSSSAIVEGSITDELLHELRVHQIELEMQNEELRCTQISLEETRDRFIDLYEFAPTGYLTLTPDAIISEINLTAATLLGIERKERLTLRFARFVAPEDRDKWHRHFLDTIKKNGTHDCELLLQRFDGSGFYAGLNCVCVESGGKTTVRITLTDITGRKQAEALLLESEERLNAIFEGALDGILLVDMATRKFYTCNPAFCNMLGYSLEEICRIGVADVYPRQDLSSILEVFEEDACSKTKFATGMPITCKDGSVFYADIKSAPVHIGGKAYLMGIFRDITERRQAEMESREQQQLLREMSALNLKLREKERKHIAGEVHDELGQILSALRMKIALLRIQFGEKNPELVGNIKEMLVMVDDAIQGVRNVAHNLRPSVLDLGIIPAIEWLCDKFNDRANVACTMQLIDGNVILDEPGTLTIFRIVQESLTNVARHAEANSVKITVGQSRDDVFVEVRDDGKGFNPAYVPLRKSFGLMGMRERAFAADGVVEISSAPAKGTVVRIRMPIKPKENIK